MSVNMELYKVFYHVKKSGSISRAAVQLYISQPAVSRAIISLEKAIGCKLFERSSKGVKLTLEGDILFDHLEKAFNNIYAAENKINEIQNLLHGEVKIGVSDTLCRHYLLPYLQKFNQQYPQIKINLTDPSSPQIINLIKKGSIDFGIVNLPLVDEELEIKKTYDLQDCFVVGEKFKNLAEKELSVHDLANYPVLLLNKASNTRRFIDNYFKSNNVTIIPDIELGTIELLVKFAETGLGISCVIKNFVSEELEAKSLFEIKLKEKMPPRGVGIAFLKSISLSVSSKKFIDILIS